MKIKNKTYLILPILILTSVFLINKYFIINVTPSMEMGIYLKLNADINKGDIVLFCLDQKNQSIGLMHHYLPQGRICNGADPLIKEVVAVPGDKVVLLNYGIKVNEIFFAYQTLSHDHNQQPLANFPRGSYSPTNGYWVIGSHAKNSWDSRYWGPITRKQIIARLIPLMTWR